MAAACARRPGGRWEGPARRCPPPPPTPAHSSHLARPCPDAPGTRPPSSGSRCTCGAATARAALLSGRPATKAAAATAAIGGGPRPAAAQTPPTSRSPASPEKEPLQPRGPRALTGAERTASPQGGDEDSGPALHRAIGSAAPAAPARPLATERGHVVGGEGRAGPRVLGGGLRAADVSRPRRCFRRRRRRGPPPGGRGSGAPRWLARWQPPRWAIARRSTGERGAQASRHALGL